MILISTKNYEFSTLEECNYVSATKVKTRNNTLQLSPQEMFIVDKSKISEKTLDDLRWIMQKDILGQDIFLIGRPGSHRRRLVMQYLELINGEAEEIISGTAKYIDQCAVQAASKGRFLVLDGIEKAERNVLPVLNNLLENREMQLEDGRLLISSSRYDTLLQNHTKDELELLNLVRVSENFRVIALGLPVPAYVGHPLDPPLRSRFQARDVHQYGYKEQIESYGSGSPVFAQILSFAHTLMTDEVSSIGLPDLPLENMEYISQILANAPSTSPHSLVTRLVPTGNHMEKNCSKFVSISYHEGLLSEMMTSHSVGDFCIIGPKGCGKSLLVKRFADLLHYDVEPIMLYQDMTSRDLLQQRTTLENGDTVWKMSPLIQAALTGKMAILDGVHKLHRGSLGILQRLTHDREVQLYDGSRLLRHDRYDALVKEFGQTIVDETKLLRIHPAFRIVAIAENPTSDNQWLCPEMLSTFLYHSMRPLNYEEELKVLESLTGIPNKNILEVLQFAHRLRSSSDISLQSIANSISTRQVLRIARRMNQFDSESAFEALNKTCLSEFLPTLPKETLKKALSENNFLPRNTYSDSEAIKVILKYLKLYSMKLLKMEYIQLHRDTTVQSLTVTPSVKDGVIVYEDSPLVKAVKSGYVLVIDEADKAPTQVTCILKTLIETGEMILSDGRRISKFEGSDSIKLNPDFRTIVLANRPGFPFLGNDFFTLMRKCLCFGDMDLTFPEEILKKFVEIFSELRNLADEGSIQYPYSTREVVNIIKHMEQFPDDGISSVVRNVFDFDSYDKETRNTLEEVLEKHGIPISNESKVIKLSPLISLPHKRKAVGTWHFNPLKNVHIDKLPSKTLSIVGSQKLAPSEIPLDVVVESRGYGFTEMYSYKVFPYHDHAMTADIVVNKDEHGSILNDVVHVLTKNPYWLYSHQLGDKKSLVRRKMEKNSKSYSTRQLLKSNDGSTETLRFLVDGNTLEVLQNITSECPLLSTFKFSFVISDIHYLGENRFLIKTDQNKYLIFNENEHMDSVELFSEYELGIVNTAELTRFSGEEKMTSNENKSNNSLLITSDAFGVLFKNVLGLNSSEENEIIAWPRESDLKKMARNTSLFLPQIGQTISPISKQDIPKDYPIYDDDVDYLEVVDLSVDKRRFLSIPRSLSTSSSINWYQQTYKQNSLKFCPTSNEGFLTIDLHGTLRVWETGLANLHRSLMDWKKMMGAGNRHQLTISKDEVGDLSSPKHGKVDPENTPHVGGNTWAGGTGGRDTAGLGGIGGPYRLDAGHDVHQLSDDIKDSVPEHVRAAAREMNRKAYEEKLREIRMSPYEADLYDRYSSGVTKQIQNLRLIISGLQAKALDRQWLKHQTSGELDDTRLIEGIAGEKNVYKKRADLNPEPGSVQEKPKKLRLLVDVSGSMYRFNGHDQRLERTLESALMVMESFQGYESKIVYDIFGHSGEEAALPFMMGESDIPNNNKDRLQILKKYGSSFSILLYGRSHIRRNVMSDANFDRYGISPEAFAKILTKSDKVCTYAIFIGSLGDQARVLTKKLPSGKAFVFLNKDTDKNRKEY
ncbi:von Willebrand factor A domain-containing protein 8 [Lepeophtheirus salmonis]|uniref:von Willebrand factor A domain-containing protein 8 n=1 Tax=Lepeophtheirus salmonis TaxID=72036 RepID=A0A7R8D4R8_LEPSM|nr:von Willebrand factor A domain-containing protein 8 [Lepeophtheirus salmonis]CAF3028096.1 von Willebrand factor A domain-containing protein 8 [Lepeophtheirus salmonis]